MQPTKSEPSLSQSAERAIPASRLSDESSTTLRVDAPPSTSNRVHAPHRPIGPARQPGTARPRAERPAESPAELRDNRPNDVDPKDLGTAKEPELNRKNPGHDVVQDETYDLNWATLQAENIARILEQRLQEVERRERMLNRRAALIAQQERMFRLWSNDQRLEMERLQRELKHREAALNQRSSDLRWLLVYGDQFCSESPSDLGTNSVAAPHFANHDPDNFRRFNDEKRESELFFEMKQLEFMTDQEGIRRLDRP